MRASARRVLCMGRGTGPRQPGCSPPTMLRRFRDVQMDTGGVRIPGGCASRGNASLEWGTWPAGFHSGFALFWTAKKIFLKLLYEFFHPTYYLDMFHVVPEYQIRQELHVKSK